MTTSELPDLPIHTISNGDWQRLDSYDPSQECVYKCLKRNYGVFACISVLISLDLPPASLRKITLKCKQIHSKLHLPAFRSTL